MLEDIVQIAKEAGDKILDFYNQEIEVKSKDDESPLTKADLAAHYHILKRLNELDPSIPVISEESGIPEYKERKKWERFWMVDPLDGTKEFIKRNSEFTVNIALIEKSKPILGVVYVPVKQVCYTGEKSAGSFKITIDGIKQRLNTPEFKRPGNARIVVSRSHGDDHTKQKMRSLGIEVTEEITSGSSLKFCLVAEGRADIYPRLGPTMEWDTAAADAVYRYSSKEKVKYSPLIYNKENLLNPYFIIGINEYIDAEVINK